MFILSRRQPCLSDGNAHHEKTSTIGNDQVPMSEAFALSILSGYARRCWSNVFASMASHDNARSSISGLSESAASILMILIAFLIVVISGLLSMRISTA